MNGNVAKTSAVTRLLGFRFDVRTFCCLFFMLSILQETQTGQPSNNFPWFFDLFTSFQRTASREDVFTFFLFDGVYFLLFFSLVFGVGIIFKKLKQVNQAKNSFQKLPHKPNKVVKNYPFTIGQR